MVEWAALIDAAEAAPNREMMRPMLRYTSGSTGRPKGVRRNRTGPRKDFTNLLQQVANEMMQPMSENPN